MHREANPAVCAQEGPSCKNNALKEDYDPRSYCHSIISHPETVCKGNVCLKSQKKTERESSENIVCTPYSTCKTKRFSDKGSDSNMEDIPKIGETHVEDKGKKIKDKKDDIKTTEILYEYSKYPENKITLSKETLLSGITANNSNDDTVEPNERTTKSTNQLYTQKASPRKSNVEKSLEMNRNENVSHHAEETSKASDNLPVKMNSSKKLIIEKVFDMRQSEKTGSSAQNRPNLRKMKKYDENTLKLLRELTKTLGSEGISAISHLVKAEICSCCKCMICKCKMKRMNSGLSSIDRETPRDYQKEMLEMEMAYSWAFDYLDSPDLENYEKQRQERFELERHLAEEEEVSLLIEEILKEEGAHGDEKFSDAQTKHILEKMKEIVNNGTITEIESSRNAEGGPDTKTTVNEEEIIKYKEKRNILERTPRKQNELEHAKNHNPISTEQRPQSKASGEKDAYSTNKKIISTASTLKEVHGNRVSVTPSSRPPPRHSISSSNRKSKRKKKLQRSLNEPRNRKIKRMSYKESVTLSQESNQWNISPVDGTALKFQERNNIQDFGGSVLINEHTYNESANDIVEEGSINNDQENLTKSSSAVKLSSKLILAITKASETAKKKAEARQSTLHPSLRIYTDVCNCLPGTCNCGSHYLFRNIKLTTPIDMNDDEKEPSCLCLHSMDEVEEEEEEEIVHDLTFSPYFRMQLPQSDYTLCPKKPRYEKTVIIIKPEATIYKDVVLRAIKKEGLDILDERIVQLTPEQVTEIYDENNGSAYFFMFIKQMSSTPIWVFSVAGISAVERWKKVIGEDQTIHASWFYPESIKRRFGLHTDIYGAMKTSTDAKSVKRDLKFFFPLDILEPIAINSVEVQDYCDEYINPTLLKGLYMVALEKPDDPIMYLADWVLRNNPNTPSFTNSLITLAPT